MVICFLLLFAEAADKFHSNKICNPYSFLEIPQIPQLCQGLMHLTATRRQGTLATLVSVLDTGDGDRVEGARNSAKGGGQGGRRECSHRTKTWPFPNLKQVALLSKHNQVLLTRDKKARKPDAEECLWSRYQTRTGCDKAAVSDNPEKRMCHKNGGRFWWLCEEYDQTPFSLDMLFFFGTPKYSCNYTCCSQFCFDRVTVWAFEDIYSLFIVYFDLFCSHFIICIH